MLFKTTIGLENWGGRCGSDQRCSNVNSM